MSTSKRTLVYGIGNPYRCDDAVGIKVAQEIAEQIKSQDIDVKWGSIDGVAILDEIVDYHRVIFIDSIKTNKGKPGDVYKIRQPSGKSTEIFSSHGINFLTAIRFGEKFKLNMPVQIDVYAVEIKDNTSFTEECTADVLHSVPKVVQVILEEIKETDGTKLRKNKNRI